MTQRRLQLGLGAGLTFLPLAACTFVQSLDYLQNGRPTLGLDADATSPFADGGSDSRVEDSQLSDGKAPDDGNMDSGPFDGGSLRDAQNPGPKRFCQTQSPLNGVTDFFCADFDGKKLDEGFTKVLLEDGGAAGDTAVLARRTDVFSSPPASLSTMKGGALYWEKLGGMPFIETVVDVRIHAGALAGPVGPSSGFITLLKVSTIGLSATTAGSYIELRYQNGPQVDGGGAEYTGYSIWVSSCEDNCSLLRTPLPNQLPVNVWTDVRLVWQNSGAVKVTFNGLSVFESSSVPTNSAKISATLGVVESGPVLVVGTYAFDNFIVSVKR
jgi:hypothetical protein